MQSLHLSNIATTESTDTFDGWSDTAGVLFPYLKACASVGKAWLMSGLVASMGLVPMAVSALDLSVSGFGTLGYARSDEPFIYDRFINNGGTLRRDSVIGLQVDSKFLDGFGATLQVKAAPKSDDDAKYDATVAWAFLSYRPTNDWLLRAGRQRIPLYLHSANFDVGVTHDFARLPSEMYSISPNNEIDGLSFAKTWSLNEGEVTLDGIWGKTNADVRFWNRDTFPTIQNAGPIFRRQSVKGGGFSLTYKTKEDTFRLSLGSVLLTDREPIPITFPFVSLFPGVGYYQIDNAFPGPGVPEVNPIRISTLNLGADVDIGSGYRVIGEFARTVVPQTDFSIQSRRGYASLFKRIDEWTPYVTYAFLRSDSRTLNLYNNVNNNTVPGFVPGAALINATQRAGGDQIFAFDQSSVAIGTAYALSATQKIKAEWMRVRIGQVSKFVDAPSGGNIRNQNINVISLSYSFVF